MSDSVEEHRAKQRRTAIDALDRGRAALAAGELAPARRWLDRARRVTGGNDTIELLLATVLLRSGQAREAAGMFAELAERHDLREAWLGLAAGLHRMGDAACAAAALGSLLCGHVLDDDVQLRALADEVSRAAGFAGWCGMDAGHRPVVGVAAGAVRFELDGRAVRGLPRGLGHSGVLAVRGEAGALLGSPLLLARMARLEGFVDAAEDGGLAGWAWHPNQPASVPALWVVGTDGSRVAVAVGAPDTESSRETERHDRPFAQPRRFVVAPGLMPGGLLRVVGNDGRDLPGSPVDPRSDPAYGAAVARAVAGRSDAAEDRAALLHAPVPASHRGVHVPGRRRGARRVSVVVPVYRGLAATLACLDSVFASSVGVGAGVRVVVVDDASPEPELAAALDRLAATGRITLVRHARNHGFPSAANSGMRAAGRDDVVLLNADTLVAGAWLAGLRAAAYAAEDVGTATPFSNDATLLSYPRQGGNNAVPDMAATARLNRLADRANAGVVIEIPTGVGFCMFVRRECLDQVGLLRQDLFAQGYGEENDFCMRARHLGWRHVAAAGVFVSHIGGTSFGAARGALLRRNLAVLNRMHPGYDALIAADEAGPGLAAARRRFDLARVAEGRRRLAGPAVVLITHDMGGGVERQIGVRCAALREAGERPIVIRPVLARPLLQGTGECTVDLGDDLPNLVYDVASEMAGLVRLLAGLRVRLVELHHLLGHAHAVTRLAGLLRVPYEVHVHDYLWFCPRVTLVGFERRYCGEPEIAGCVACVADAGRNTDDETPVAEFVARSGRDLAGAIRVVAPSADTAARIRRHFPAVRPEVQPWDDSRPASVARRGRGQVVVGVLGAIGIEKGYDVLLACARDAAARALPLRFVVVGHTTDDARLLETGSVFVTGEYKAEGLARLIRDEEVRIGFLPSIWPETWCFTLSEAWRAGLAVIAFDIGAPAERIRLHGGGALIPLGCRAPQINALLCRDVA